MKLPIDKKIIGICLYDEETGEADVFFDDYWIETSNYTSVADGLRDVTHICEKRYNSHLKTKTVKQIKHNPINCYNVDLRGQNVLFRLGVKYLSDLRFLKESDLLRQTNFGRMSLNRLKELCLENNIIIGVETVSTENFKEENGWRVDYPKYLSHCRETLNEPT